MNSGLKNYLYYIYNTFANACLRARGRFLFHSRRLHTSIFVGATRPTPLYRFNMGILVILKYALRKRTLVCSCQVKRFFFEPLPAVICWRSYTCLETNIFKVFILYLRVCRNEHIVCILDNIWAWESPNIYYLHLQNVKYYCRR